MPQPLLQCPRTLLAKQAVLCLLLACVAACLNACASSQPVSNPLFIPSERFPIAFEQVGLELRDNGFIVDRQDLRHGLITTRPRPSPTVFEPWYDTNSNLNQIFASTLDSERRIVRISIEPSGPIPPTIVNADPDATQPYVAEPAPKPEPIPALSHDPHLQLGYKNGYPPYLIRVEVFVERLEKPTNQMSGSAYNGIFNTLHEVPTDLRQRGIVSQYWQPVGRDSFFEQRLLASLVKRMNEAQEQ